MEEGPSEHAHLTFDEIAQAGPPVRPLDFPPPIVYPGLCEENTKIMNHNTGDMMKVTGHDSMKVLYRVYPFGRARVSQEEGYWFRKQLREAIYGSVWVAVLVFKEKHEELGDIWVTSDEFVAIKRLSWAQIHRLRGRHIEDPLKEVACLQLIGSDHPNVMGCRCVLQDSEYLYSVLPYCNNGDLFDNVTRRGGEDGLEEPEARYWFRQILQGLHHLQSRGICHRDLSLENIMVNDQNCLVIDMGMCLRVPYTCSKNNDNLTDVASGMIRRLIKPQGSCGKMSYMSPEVFSNMVGFDGFAIDLWAAGSMLYIMLTGFPPWDSPNLADLRFEVIVSGRLNDQLQAWGVEISEAAADLLQRMLQLDPRHRPTLAEVMLHPWVLHDDVCAPFDDDAFDQSEEESSY